VSRQSGDVEEKHAGLPRISNQLSRASKSRAGMWFWEVDRVLLFLPLLLIAIGLVAVAAASPATARRYSDAAHIVQPMYYFWRQLMWVCICVPVLIIVSMLPTSAARRLSLAGALVFLVLMMLLPLVGHEVNGAKRWISLGISDLQPSEFLKPLFIVSTAWILSFRAKDPELPVMVVTGAITALIAVLLMLQPDFGQTILFGTVWVILLMLSGISPAAIAGLGGVAVGGVVAAYLFYGTARTRNSSTTAPRATVTSMMKKCTNGSNAASAPSATARFLDGARSSRSTMAIITIEMESAAQCPMNPYQSPRFHAKGTASVARRQSRPNVRSA